MCTFVSHKFQKRSVLHANSPPCHLLFPLSIAGELDKSLYWWPIMVRCFENTSFCTSTYIELILSASDQDMVDVKSSRNGLYVLCFLEKNSFVLLHSHHTASFYLLHGGINFFDILSRFSKFSNLSQR